VRLLLDTHIFLWICTDDDKLRPRDRDLIRSAGHDVVVSAVTPWEIAIKQATGFLTFPVETYAQTMAALGFQHLSITHKHGLAAGALPLHHRDPFDRMIIAQCRLEDCVLVTYDKRLRNYDIPILGSGAL
jgi:PIN domain nuclease of toxin-antitoxin system